MSNLIWLHQLQLGDHMNPLQYTVCIGIAILSFTGLAALIFAKRSA